MITSFGLIMALLVAASCSSEDDTSTTDEASTTTTDEASTTTTAPSTTDPAENAVSQPIVAEGGYFIIHSPVETPGGSTFGIWMDGDTSGQVPNSEQLGLGSFFGTITSTNGQITGGDGDWVIHLSVPDVGEGLLGVQGWKPVRTPTSFDGTGTAVGLSGDFTGMTGTFSTTVFEQSLASLSAGTWALELQPAEPSPDPAEPTETRTIEYQSASVGMGPDGTDVFGGVALTGDIVGSGGFVENSTFGAFAINVGTLDGESGVFITSRGPVPTRQWTEAEEFYGISGAFAGLNGVGTVTGTTFDATGARAPSAIHTFEVSG